MPEVPLSRCWPSSEMPGILCFNIVGIPIKACAAQLSYNIHSESSFADVGHSSADAGTISSHLWKKMNDNARSNPGSSFIFLMTSQTIFVVFYFYIPFFILCYMECLEWIELGMKRCVGELE